MSDTTAPSCCSSIVDLPDPEATAALADALGALADPVRLQILSIIAGSSAGEVCACDFVAPIGRSQPTISHHLKVLTAAGLITGDKRGRWVWYRAVPERISAISRSLETISR